MCWGRPRSRLRLWSDAVAEARPPDRSSRGRLPGRSFLPCPPPPDARHLAHEFPHHAPRITRLPAKLADLWLIYDLSSPRSADDALIGARPHAHPSPTTRCHPSPASATSAPGDTPHPSQTPTCRIHARRRATIHPRRRATIHPRRRATIRAGDTPHPSQTPTAAYTPDDAPPSAPGDTPRPSPSACPAAASHHKCARQRTQPEPHRHVCSTSGLAGSAAKPGGIDGGFGAPNRRRKRWRNRRETTARNLGSPAD